MIVAVAAGVARVGLAAAGDLGVGDPVDARVGALCARGRDDLAVGSVDDAVGSVDDLAVDFGAVGSAAFTLADAAGERARHRHRERERQRTSALPRAPSSS